MSIYLLVIRNWSVWMVVFLPYHELQNCNADYFFLLKVEVPIEINVSHLQKFFMLRWNQPLSTKYKMWKRKGKEESKKRTFLPCILHCSLLSKDSWLDSQVTSGKAQNLTMICFKIYKWNYSNNRVNKNIIIFRSVLVGGCWITIYDTMYFILKFNFLVCYLHCIDSCNSKDSN